MMAVIIIQMIKHRISIISGTIYTGPHEYDTFLKNWIQEFLLTMSGFGRKLKKIDYIFNYLYN